MTRLQQHKIEIWDVIDWSNGQLQSKLGSHNTVKRYIEGKNRVKIAAYECEDFRKSIEKYLKRGEWYNAIAWYNRMVQSGNWRIVLVNLENDKLLKELYKWYQKGAEPQIEIFDIETYKEVIKLKML